MYYDERGLDKYYGLLDLGELGGLWKNVAGRYEMNGKKVYAKEIYKNPDKYFTDDIMKKLNDIAVEEYSYGSLKVQYILKLNLCDYLINVYETNYDNLERVDNESKTNIHTVKFK